MEIAQKYKFDQVIARVIRNKDIVTEDEFYEYIYGDITMLNSPHLMKDIDKAAEIIKNAIADGLKIRIIGDYDIDGINSIYILYSGLVRLGADVDYTVPHRVYDGYGINERLIDEAKKEGVKVLITCDNGIAAYNQILHAKNLGMTVVVTDHHDIPFNETDGRREYVVPPADAVVDPKQVDCVYPYKKICGATVAFKFIQVMFELFNRPNTEILDFLEFAAIATVGDVVELQHENRIIVKAGLKKIANTENAGINALIDVNKLDRSKIKAYHIGFVIGPCLNASGRLDTAMKAVKLLLTSDRKEAEELAGILKALNDERKDLTLKGVENAISQIDNTSLKDDNVLVVYLPECHESIVGIIAGRIRERYNKPVIVFADGEGCLKGSGRSIESYNMFEKLSQVKHLLIKFGGHPMAAGMSIEREKLDEFRKELNKNANLTEEDLTLNIMIDVPMPVDYANLFGVVNKLDILEPFGQGNSKPVFADKGLNIFDMAHMGKEGQYTRMRLGRSESGTKIDAVMFSKSDIVEQAFADRRRIKILYYPSLNEYNGRSKMQIVIDDVMFDD